MENVRYEVKVNAQTHMVYDKVAKRFLGGIGSNYYRTYVFPLYTPSGQTVLQEFAFDHPFHNAFFVGQHPIMKSGQETNFWMAPPRRDYDPNYRNLGRVDAPATPLKEITETSAKFVLNNVWRDENEQPVLDETREVGFYSIEDAVVCEMSTTKKASYGDLALPQTKFGNIGVRIEPRILPVMGGEILADNGRRGNEDTIMGSDSDYIAYENSKAGPDTFGIFITALTPKAKGPWFVRDYGLTTLNLTLKESIQIHKGEEITVALRVIAYDGALTEERAERWKNRRVATDG